MQINLEIYYNDMDGDPIASVICNVVPRVGERILLLVGDEPRAGSYRVLAIEHLLDDRRRPPETLQHVCAVVCRAKP